MVQKNAGLGHGEVAIGEESARARVDRAHGEIRAFLERELGVEGRGRSRVLLDEIRRLLVPHFSDEEAPEGLFEAMRVVHPPIESDLKLLQQEHRKILEAMEHLERRLRGSEDPKSSESTGRNVERIEEAMSRLLQMIRRHERGESGLAAEVFNLDEGGSG